MINETRKCCSAFVVRAAKCLRFYELWISHLQNCSYYSSKKCDLVTCRAAPLKLQIETQEATRCLILFPGLAFSLKLLHSLRVGNGFLGVFGLCNWHDLTHSLWPYIFLGAEICCRVKLLQVSSTNLRNMYYAFRIWWDLMVFSGLFIVFKVSNKALLFLKKSLWLIFFCVYSSYIM